MTTTQTDNGPEPLVSVLRSIVRWEYLLFCALLATQSFVFYLVLSDREQARTDREQARTDRIVNEQRHIEVMQALRAVPNSVVQQVKIETRYGRFDKIKDE